MHPLLRSRSQAYVLDSLVHLAVPAALVPVGLLVRRRYNRPGPRLLHAFSALPPVAATLIASAQESRRGTWGHRSQGLVVRTTDGQCPGFGRALLRNTIKIGVPWQLGHVVAIGAATGELDRRHPWTMAAATFVYPWMAAAAVSVALGSGRALHDRAADTRVSPATPRQRPCASSVARAVRAPYRGFRVQQISLPQLI